MSSPSKDQFGSPLRPRARLLRTLGSELISNEVVAVIELVKNSYDADATRVLIRFVPPLEPGKGSIEVMDNGHGMDLKTVQAAWMEPATSSKRNTIRSVQLKRRYLGEKGIGRFASSRLADELEVISRRDGATKEVHAVFDWRQFDDDNKFLDEILILWEEREPVELAEGGTIDSLWKSDSKRAPKKHDLNHGTILRMSGLKQPWRVRQFEDLRRGLTRLISPNKPKGGQEFSVELDLPTEFLHLSSKIEPPAILNYPHYIVKGSVSSTGAFNLVYKILGQGKESNLKGKFLRISSAKGMFEVRAILDGESEPPSESKDIECGPLEIELRVWDRDELGNVIQRTNSTLQDVRRDLDAVAGVNIFRDGFRVLPYGEPQDDWLRLDLRRVQNPTFRLSNNQIFGVIYISADSNPSLRDQSNREGLDENQSLEDLRGVMTEILNRLEAMRYKARPHSAKQSGKPIGGLFAGFDFQPLVKYIEKQFPKDTKVKELVEQTEQAFGDQLKEIQTVLARYQRLATLGQLIDHVLHEGRQPIALINNEADLGASDVQGIDLVGPELSVRLKGRFKVIRKQGDALATAFNRMEPFGGRRRGRPGQLYLEDIVRDAFVILGKEIDHLNVKTLLPQTQTLVRVDPAELQEVIINLLQNSLYWLNEVKESNREIAVKIERKGEDHVEILFSDSGPGVSSQNRELIFQPYFTTKPNGVGLGLSIVGEIVSDYYGGELQLLKQGPLKGANFLVTLRKRV